MMIPHRCVIKTCGLFGVSGCEREGIEYDPARRGWLCLEHLNERLCEFCQSERAWARLCYEAKQGLGDVWLCPDCIGIRSGR